MKESYVFFNGKIVDEREASLSIRSRIVNYGLGCFEGIRAYWDEESRQLYAFKLREHYERLLQSCKTLNNNIPYSVQQLCDYTVELLRKNNYRTTVYIRPLAYKGGELISPTLMDDDDRLFIYCVPMGNYSGKEEVRVSVTSWQRLRDNMLPPRAKATAAYMNSALASLEVMRNGFDEAIFLSDTGNVCEGPGENIFIVKKGKLVTPHLSDNILEGITRDIIMTLAREELGMEVVERSISRTELYSAEEAFFSGTAMEVLSIVEVDRRIIGTGRQGEVCKKLKKLFFEITKCKNPKYASCCTPIY